MIQFRGVDLNVFQFDWDQTWAAMFLNAELGVYGRYGTRFGERTEGDRLISVAGLRNAMARALALHKAKAAAKPLAQKPVFVETLPSMAGRFKGDPMKACVHCHHAYVGTRRAKKTLTEIDVYPFPMPDAIGMKIDVDEGNKVVSATGIAAAGGVKAGDVILTMQSAPILSVADMQWILHNAAAEQQLKVEVERDGKKERLNLSLAGDWRKYDISWRESTWDLRPGMRLVPVPEPDRRAAGIADGKLALAVKFVSNQGAAKKAGFAAGDIVVDWDGKSDAMTESELIALLRTKYAVGSKVPVGYLRGGKRQKTVLEVP
jgi:hypothetical protein